VAALSRNSAPASRISTASGEGAVARPLHDSELTGSVHAAVRLLLHFEPDPIPSSAACRSAVRPFAWLKMTFRGVAGVNVCSKR